MTEEIEKLIDLHYADSIELPENRLLCFKRVPDYRRTDRQAVKVSKQGSACLQLRQKSAVTPAVPWQGLGHRQAGEGTLGSLPCRMPQRERFSMVMQRLVSEVMTSPLFTVQADTPLQEAVALLNQHHISALPVVGAKGELLGELSEQDLMVRESGFEAGPYVLLLDSVIYLKNPLQWDKEVHQVLGNFVEDLINRHPHTCALDLPLPQAAKLLHNGKTQRLFVLNPEGMPVGVLTRGDVVRALAEAI